MGVTETLAHFMCVCPRFREARTASHNRAFACVSNFLQQTISVKWKLYVETPLGSLGLQLQDVRIDGEPTSLQRWQPDAVAISWHHKRIGIVEFSRPADTSSEQLTVAYTRKKEKYHPVQTALQHYLDAGWQVEILPWIVGIRGLIQASHIQEALTFFEIPQSKLPAAVERTITSSSNPSLLCILSVTPVTPNTGS